MTQVDVMTVGAVRFFWPTPVLMRRYQPEAEEGLGREVTPRLTAWFEQAGRDLLADMSRPKEQLPALKLVVTENVLDDASRTPPRTPGAVMTGVFCIDPGDERSPVLTFLDPRNGAEMIPGTSAPSDPV